jgi:hypothetical protein
MKSRKNLVRGIILIYSNSLLKVCTQLIIYEMKTSISNHNEVTICRFQEMQPRSNTECSGKPSDGASEKNVL